jgi:Fur family transcriptional regulator, ferric uptake regulator
MPPESMVAADDFTQQAGAFWEQRGGRMTVVRRIICQAIAGRESAFVAEELWQEVKKQDRGIAMASVYRALADLLAASLLREIHGPREQRSFVKSGSTCATTGHLICKDCHRIVPLSNDCLALREGAMIRGLGFQTGGMHLQIEAACESLKRCGTCANKVQPS